MADSAASISLLNAAASVTVRVPARSRLCLLESFFEVFKLAGHGRPRRGCDDALPTMELSWRYRRRLDRAVSESRQTTPLQRRRLLRLRDFESARQRVRLSPPQKVEELLSGAAWRPYKNIMAHSRRPAICER